MSGIEDRSGLTPRGNYRLTSEDAGIISTSSLGPFDSSHPTGFSHVGRLGRELDANDGAAAAAQAARALLEAVELEVGDLNAIDQVLTVRGYLATTEDFVDHAAVMDGASQVLVDALGERGRHCRTSVGVASLPFGIPVVIELTARLRKEPAS